MDIRRALALGATQQSLVRLHREPCVVLGGMSEQPVDPIGHRARRNAECVRQPCVKPKRARVPRLPRLALVAFVAVRQTGCLVGPEQQAVDAQPRCLFRTRKKLADEPLAILGAERCGEPRPRSSYGCRHRHPYAATRSRSTAGAKTALRIAVAQARARSGGTAFPTWR